MANPNRTDEGADYLDASDDVSRALIQLRGICSVVGALDINSGDLPDAAVSDAMWAARALIERAEQSLSAAHEHWKAAQDRLQSVAAPGVQADQIH